MATQRLRLIDLSVSLPARILEIGDEINLNEETEGADEVSLAAVYELMGDVYRSCDYFCQGFEERYPTPAALADEIRSYKAWRRQVEAGRRGVTTAESSLAGRCAAPMYLIAVLDDDDDAGGKPRLVGFVRLSPSKVPRQGHTTDVTMGLSPAVQGQGLGTRLLQLTLDRIRAENQALKGVEIAGGGGGGQGVEIVYLMVREDNKAAIALYRKVGFEQVAVLHRDTKINDDLYYDGIMMRLFV